MQQISYFSESFNTQKLASYYLNIELSKWGLVYSIYDVIRVQFVAVVAKTFENPEADLIDNLQKTIIDEVYLNKHFKVVNFILVNNNYTLVPEEVFSKKNKKDYLEFSSLQKIDNDELLFSFVEPLKLYSVFSYPSLMVNFLVNQFPEIRFFHSSCNILSSLLSLANATNQNTLVLVDFYPEFFNVAYLNNQKLEFYNNFNFDTAETAAYHVLNIVNKFNLKNTPIYLQGDIDNKNKAYTYLKSYIENIKFRVQFGVNLDLKQTSTHYFANVFTVLQ